MTNEEFELFDEDVESPSLREYAVKLDKKSPPSVYYCNYRSIYEDNYPAKFNEELARMLIHLYSNPGDLIMDPMAGSGVVPLVAYSLDRRIWYQDINELAKDLFVKKLNLSNLHAEIRVYDSTIEIAAQSNSIDLILTSPPFGLTIDQKHDRYSDNPEDLGNSLNYETWRAKMKKILANCFRVLKPGKLMIVETRPRSKKGASHPLNAWIITDGIETGFEFYTEFIEIVQPYRMWTFGDFDRRMPIPMHSYLTILRKPENENLCSYY
jgi:DNA modification methylase